MEERRLEEVGQVSKFFAHPSVAVLELKAPIKVGETILIKGHTTDLTQVIASMEVDHAAVSEAQPGQPVGIKVDGRCRKHDTVFKVVG